MVEKSERQNPAMTARLDTPTSPMTANGQALAAMPCCALRVLRLTLKRHWFDMIASGEKREEYRTAGKWILSRLEGKEYDRIEFKNGYGQNVPTMEVEYLGWAYSFGKRQWGGGGEQGKPFATIYLGRVISLHNVKVQELSGGK
jgi:hypothetical protein